MIAAVLAQVVGASPAANAQAPPLLAPEVVIQRYAAALMKVKAPRVLTFDYTLEQTGMRTLAQTHRIFRSGLDERDETLSVDGKRLTPPKIRIFHSRPDRYAIRTLAPRPLDYRFTLTGLRKNGHHIDYVFHLTPHVPRLFAITDLTIDGVQFLPSSVAFAARTNAGSGTITFGRNAGWWIPYFATARATVGTAVAAEKLAFYTYRFPVTLPPSTFTQAHRPAPEGAAPLSRRTLLPIGRQHAPAAVFPFKR